MINKARMSPTTEVKGGPDRPFLPARWHRSPDKYDKHRSKARMSVRFLPMIGREDRRRLGEEGPPDNAYAVQDQRIRNSFVSPILCGWLVCCVIHSLHQCEARGSMWVGGSGEGGVRTLTFSGSLSPILVARNVFPSYVKVEMSFLRSVSAKAM